jgi:ATP-dependent protease HslVU (ClpYQ) peptidase subunit
MTTIAITKNQIAGEQQVTLEGCTFNSTKVFKFHSYLFRGTILAGAAGDGVECESLIEYLKTGEDGEDLEFKEVCAIVSDGEAIYYYDSSIIPIKVDDPHFAIGSGAPYALAILDYGGSMIDAIAAAIKRDECSSGKIEVLTLCDSMSI